MDNLTRGQHYTFNNEAIRTQTYDDATGKPIKPGDQIFGTLTIGIGHTGPDVNGKPLMPGDVWTEDKCETQFLHDYDIAIRGAKAIFHMEFPYELWDNIGEARQAVLADLIFNMGALRLSRFEHFRFAVENHNWEDAALELEWSDQARTVHTPYYDKEPIRAAKNMYMLRVGDFANGQS